MSSIEAFIFGLIQALTEFFPVSSSAHLKMAKLLLGIDSTENTVLLDLCCHLGTLVAVVYFLRKEIIRIFSSDYRKLSLLFFATLPLVPFYFLLKPLRDFASDTRYLGYCLFITGIIIYIGQKIRFRTSPTEAFKRRFQDALCIGAMQSAALIPGISRSASTISCATSLGWQPKDAVEFSFLLSIPTIIAGNAMELLKTVFLSHEPLPIETKNCLIAFFTSLIVGLIVVRFAMRILERGRLKPFAWYCMSIGILATFYFQG